MPLTNGINLIQRFTPANIYLDEDVFQIRLQKTSSGRLQDVLMKTNISLLTYVFRRGLQDVFKMSWSRPIYSSCPYVFKTSSSRFQDVFKMSCHNVFKTFSRHFQDVLPKRLKDVFKAFSRSLANTSGRHLQVVLKTYHQVKLFLLTSL